MRYFHWIRWRTVGVCAAIGAATILVYSQTFYHPFVDWDDSAYIFENPHVRSGLSWSNFLWSFSIHGPSQWVPLAWLSHQLDSELFGADHANAGGHHLFNALIHLLASLAFLAAFLRLTGAFWPSALVAAVFALHPLSVESVAWASERRDTLCAFFWATTLWAYAGYALHGGRWRYLLTVLCFILGLMGKPTLVTLPGILLLLDYWPLRRLAKSDPRPSLSSLAAKSVRHRTGGQLEDRSARPAAQSRAPSEVSVSGTWKWILLEKAPLCALAGLSIWLTYLCQLKANAICSAPAIPLSHRLANAVQSYVSYLGNMAWPTKLSAIYPFPKTFETSRGIVLAVLLLMVTLFFASVHSKKYLLVGWLWYLISLLPVIGLLRMGTDVAMADRWVYIPMIGIYVMVAWSLYDLTVAFPKTRVGVIVISFGILTALGVISKRQTSIWGSSKSLFENAVAVTSENSLARLNLGHALFRLNQIDEAVMQYEQALQIAPDYVEAHNDLGNVFLSQGRHGDAIKHYQSAVRLLPDYAVGHYNLGVVFQELKHLDQAEVEFKEALRIKPDYAEAHVNLAIVLVVLRRPHEAVQHCDWALQLSSTDVNAVNSLAWQIATQGPTDPELCASAIRMAEKACKSTGNKVAEYLDTLAAAYASAGRFPDAVAEARKAVTLARSQGQIHLATDIERRLDSYMAGRPYQAAAPLLEFRQ